MAEILRKFAKYYRPHFPLFTLDFSCAFLMAVLDLVFPKMVSKIIDDILPAKDLNFMFKVGIVLLALYLARYILEYIVHFYGHVLGTKIEYDMRQDLFDHIQKLSFTFFDNNKTGHIMSRLVNDLNEISELAHHGPEDVFIASVTLLGALIILLRVNWQLALVTFSVLPLMLWLAVIKNRQMRKVYKNTRAKIADINAQAEDSISGIREVKAFTNEEYEIDKFAFRNEGFRKAKEDAYRAMAEFFSGINFFSNLISLLVIIVGGYLSIESDLTIGELVGFLLYVSMFLLPIRRITSFLEIFQNGMAGFARFQELVNTHPDIDDKPNAIKVRRLSGNIVFDDVSFSYDDNSHVFSNIGLNIASGETVALVGPSGAGKTTLASLIPRFYEVESGIIRIDGIDIRDITQRSLRKNIGIVQQDVFLFTGTVRENIAYGRPNAEDSNIVEAAKKANAHDFITALDHGYDTYIGERGVKLSGGQKQRLAIARIFLKNPPILILDEATSALDNETEKVIQESLFSLSKGRTTVIIAHRLGTIRHAHRIMVLTEKGIVEEGSHDELLTYKGEYYRLYNAQFNDEG